MNNDREKIFMRNIYFYTEGLTKSYRVGEVIPWVRTLVNCTSERPVSKSPKGAKGSQPEKANGWLSGDALSQGLRWRLAPFPTSVVTRYNPKHVLLARLRCRTDTIPFTARCLLC